MSSARDEPNTREAEIERILADYLLNVNEEGGLTRAQFLARHPDMAEELEERLLEQAEAQQQLVRLTRAPSGQRLGDFRLIREIGRGGMGIVYEAEQISLRRTVALKVLPAHVTLDPRAVERFQREATIAAKLHHASIVDIHAVGEANGAHFFAMELIEGTPLDRLIGRMRDEAVEKLHGRTVGDIVTVESLHPSVPRKPEDASKKSSGSSAWSKSYIETAVRLVIQIADALEYAHQQGVIHRDIKPSNILVRTDGVAFLTDFGLAQRVGQLGLTRTGELAGTIHYLSPEQAMAKRVQVDHRTDIFSLGATLFELLTLRRAFEGGTQQEVLTQILTRDPPDPGRLNPALAPDLATIVLKALEKDPDRRYRSAQAFADDLRAFVEYRPIFARRTATAVRIARWVRREPTRAALIGTLLVGVPLVGVLVERFFSQGAELAKAQIESRLETGFLRLAEAELGSAESEFERILRDQPHNAEALAGLALARLRKGDAPGALHVLEPETGLSGQATALDWIRADALRASGSSAAADELERGLSEPHDDLALYLAGWRKMREGFGSTNWSFAPLLMSAVTPPASGEWGSTLLDAPADRRPRDLRGSLRGALRLLSRSIALSKSPRALYHFASVFVAVRLPDAEAARQSADAIERFWPNSARALMWAGVARLAYDLEGARGTLERALALNPELPLAHYYLGEVYLRMDDLPAAVAALRAETTLSPEHPATRNALGGALFLSGRPEASIAEYRRAIAIDPRFVEAHSDLARALLEAGQTEAAIGACREALKLDPEFGAAQFIECQARQRSGDLPSAIAGWKQYIERRPEDANARSNLGRALLAAGQIESAIAEHERAVASDPKDARKQHNLGLAYNGQAARAHDQAPRRKALACIEAALELDPHFSAAHHWAARISGELGDLRAQRLALERWTSARPDDAFAWNDLAWYCVDPKDLVTPRDVPTALLASARAVELRGEDPVMLDTRAWALFRDGKLDDAVAVEQRAYAATPADDPARAEIAANLERFTLARQAAESR